jgi:hypothetical protein
VDFSIGERHVDVKGISRNVEPRPSYAAWVREVQWQNPGRINCYVFGTYVLPKKKAIITGWLSRSEFGSIAEFHEEGWTDENGFRLDTDARVTAIRNLRDPQSIFTERSALSTKTTRSEAERIAAAWLRILGVKLDPVRIEKNLIELRSYMARSGGFGDFE